MKQSKYPVELKRIHDVEGSSLSEQISYATSFLKRINDNMVPKPKYVENDQIHSEKVKKLVSLKI